MYVQEQVDKLRADAEKFVIDNDRSLYWPYFKFMEEYAAANNFIFASRCAIRLSLGLPYDQATYLYEFYVQNAWTVAKQLADSLATVKSAHVDSKMIALETNIPHKEFTITVMGRYIAKLYSIDIRHGVDAIELLKPKTIKCYLTDNKVYVVNEEILLIDIYRTLHSPSKNAMWDEQFTYESELFERVQSNIKEITLSIKTGKDEFDWFEEEPVITGGAELMIEERTGGRDDMKYEINKLILNELIDEQIILIGDTALWAHQQLKHAHPTNLADNQTLEKQRIQIVCDYTVDEILTRMRGLISEAFPKYGIKYIKHNTDLPNDFQTIKYIFYLTIGESQYSIFDMYNNLQFEILPYVQCRGDLSHVRIGNLFVLLRFKLIDLWMLRIAYMSVAKNPQIANTIINIISDVQLLRGLTKNIKLSELFQLDNYAGHYISENVARKKMLTRFMQRYMPALATNNA